MPCSGSIMEVSSSSAPSPDDLLPGQGGTNVSDLAALPKNMVFLPFSYSWTGDYRKDERKEKDYIKNLADIVYLKKVRHILAFECVRRRRPRPEVILPPCMFSFSIGFKNRYFAQGVPREKYKKRLLQRLLTIGKKIEGSQLQLRGCLRLSLLAASYFLLPAFAWLPFC